MNSSGRYLFFCINNLWLITFSAHDFQICIFGMLNQGIEWYFMPFACCNITWRHKSFGCVSAIRITKRFLMVFICRIRVGSGKWNRWSKTSVGKWGGKHAVQSAFPHFFIEKKCVCCLVQWSKKAFSLGWSGKLATVSWPVISLSKFIYPNSIYLIIIDNVKNFKRIVF